MRILSRGAEAKLLASEYLGRKSVVKMRERKKYRAKELDEKIIAERLRNECSLLSRAKKAGVRTPAIWKVEPENFTLVLEFIRGRTLKEELLKGTRGAEKLCKLAGKEVAKLHSNGIVHGDLTTGNIIVHGKMLAFLDFGLGKISGKAEDFAVDMLAFRKTFRATHFNLLSGWKALEKSYAAAFPRGKEVLRQIERVEARARYY